MQFRVKICFHTTMYMFFRFFCYCISLYKSDSMLCYADLRKYGGIIEFMAKSKVRYILRIDLLQDQH